MSKDKEKRQPKYPRWSGEPTAPDILEQGSDRPPARWLSYVKSHFEAIGDWFNVSEEHQEVVTDNLLWGRLQP